ncbi:hypothetical protein M427DRAFT_160189 [Gonapodya prolifera JEL478]|uniref:Uncharacterized protein n=1 Tax=Gonapodya prolifera (strain JEL478) TaxID=1344416 RepID=A0A138ZZR5_GONPJ|nr:hypothetical protein M427DRAFT_160189 [Gonapodya prolifera JEL478]|eukprot:KXS09765.1 hypothetical protein M427DRAFT_160189 [Gonapodya prolifera JEL478]
MLLTTSAVRNENIFEVFGAIFFSAVVFASTIASATTDTDLCKIVLLGNPSFPVDPTLWYARYLSSVHADSMDFVSAWGHSIDAMQVVACAICAVQLVGQLAMLRWVWLEVKWKAFKKIGADRAMRFRYSAFTFLTVEIKVSIYFAFLAGFYLCSHGVWSYTTPFLDGTVAVYALYAASLLGLSWGSQKEYFAPVVAFLVVGVAFEVVTIMQLATMWPRPATFTYDTFFLVRDAGTFFCIFNIFITGAIIVTGAVCASNFGRGLKEYVDRGCGCGAGAVAAAAAAAGTGKGEKEGGKGDDGVEKDTERGNGWALE